MHHSVCVMAEMGYRHRCQASNALCPKALPYHLCQCFSTTSHVCDAAVCNRLTHTDTSHHVQYHIAKDNSGQYVLCFNGQVNALTASYTVPAFQVPFICWQQGPSRKGGLRRRQQQQYQAPTAGHLLTKTIRGKEQQEDE